MGRVQPKVPMKAYGILVTMYFAVSVVNNYALNFDIPMPLHMIFRYSPSNPEAHLFFCHIWPLFHIDLSCHDQNSCQVRLISNS